MGATQITGRVCASSISAGDYTITIDPIEGGYRLSVTRGSEVQTMDLMHGVGIVGVEKTGSTGDVDSYRITFTDGSTFEYTVETNAATYAAAEAARAEAENSRDSAESERVSAEAGRVNAEDARVAAEAGRESAETARASAESVRAQAEDGRQSAEATRSTAEQNRAAAESVRVAAENARAAAETARANAENERARICILSPMRVRRGANDILLHVDDYADYIKTKAKSYCLPILNLTDESGFHPWDVYFSQRWCLYNDGVHPNEEWCRRFLSTQIGTFLMSLI